MVSHSQHSLNVLRGESSKFGIELISLLGRACCPAAILWTVAFVIINALNRMLSTRSFSHVGIESIERISPSFADFDSAQTIDSPLNFAFGFAPSFYTYPSPVLSWMQKVTATLVRENSPIFATQQLRS
jgi:hypothetical protein